MPSFGFGNSNRKSAVREAQIIIEKWGQHCNTKRPLSAVGHRPPGPQTILQMDQRPDMH